MNAQTCGSGTRANGADAAKASRSNSTADQASRRSVRPAGAVERSGGCSADISSIGRSMARSPAQRAVGRQLRGGAKTPRLIEPLPRCGLYALTLTLGLLLKESLAISEARRRRASRRAAANWGLVSILRDARGFRCELLMMTRGVG